MNPFLLLKLRYIESKRNICCCYHVSLVGAPWSVKKYLIHCAPYGCNYKIAVVVAGPSLSDGVSDRECSCLRGAPTGAATPPHLREPVQGVWASD